MFSNESVFVMGMYLVKEIYLVRGEYLVMELFSEIKIYYLLMGISSVTILISFIRET